MKTGVLKCQSTWCNYLITVLLRHSVFFILIYNLFAYMSVSLYKKNSCGHLSPSSNQQRTWHIAKCETLLKIKSADEEKARGSELPKGQQQRELFDEDRSCPCG